MKTVFKTRFRCIAPGAWWLVALFIFAVGCKGKFDVQSTQLVERNTPACSEETNLKEGEDACGDTKGDKKDDAASLDVSPPAPGGGLTASNNTGTTLDLNWTKANDLVSAQGTLKYEVRRSASNNISSLATAEANGTIIMPYATNVNSFPVTGLSPSTIYYFTVIVKDEAGLKAAYSAISAASLDIVAPTVTDAFIGLSAVEIDDGEITLSWNAATDDATSAGSMTYDVYWSINPNLDTLANTKLNGTKATTTTGITIYKIAGLTIDKDYFFNIVAKDAAANELVYTMRRPFCGGTGVNGDEWKICDPGSLQNISLHGSGEFKMTNDIDLSDSKNWNAAAGFKPIASFSGKFLGNDKSITGLYIARSASGIGLINVAAANAEILDLELIDAFINGGAFYVGTIVGTCSGAKIANVHVKNGSVKGTLMGIGGLVGGMAGACHVEMSSASGVVQGAERTGGLIGDFFSGQLIKTFASANVIGTTDVGGLVGSVSAGVTFQDNYATGNVVADTNVGGLVGNSLSALYTSYSVGNVRANTSVAGGLLGTGQSVLGGFATGNVSTPGVAGALIGGNGQPALESKWFNHPFNPANCYQGGNTNCTAKTNPTWFYNIANYDGGAGELNWDFSATGAWIMPQTGKYPVLRWENPNKPIAFPPEFRNGRKIGLSDMAAYKVWGFCGTPGATISFTGPNAPASTTCNGGTWTVNWDFSGQADGNIAITLQQGADPVVTRTLAKDTASCNGVNNETVNAQIDARFASQSPAVICNVQQMVRLQSQAGHWVFTRSYVLGNNIDLSSGYVNATIGSGADFEANLDGQNFHLKNLTLTGTANLGLIGVYDAGTISNLGLENFIVIGTDDRVGLLASRLAAGRVQNVYSTGFVMSSGGNSGGGLVGYNNHYYDSSISDSFSTADVVVKDFAAGGLIGSSQTSISRSFATGEIKCNECCGGLAGFTYGFIDSSYASGTVSAASYMGGGLVGVSYRDIINSYATGSVMGASELGGLVGVLSLSGYDGAISNSYASGSIFATSDYVGGLVGGIGLYFNSTVDIENSFSTSKHIIGMDNSNVNGLVGSVSSYIASNNHWLKYDYGPIACGISDCTIQNRASFFETSSSAVFTGWDFTTPIWKFPTSGGPPILNWQILD